MLHHCRSSLLLLWGLSLCPLLGDFSASPFFPLPFCRYSPSSFNCSVK